MLWEAFGSDEQVVLLIDEIDKADIEFPNDLLVELDKMEFFVYETGERIQAKQRPIIIITSNNEKELPDAFLRRCFFHYIQFPDKADHGGRLSRSISREIRSAGWCSRRWRCSSRFARSTVLKKKPSTSELIDWLKLLMADNIPPEVLADRDPDQGDSTAVWRSAEERAGCAYAGAAGVYGPS